MKDPVVLLTACINPNGMAFTVLQDRNVRLQQYKDALDWYLYHIANRIVFVENTGYDISPLYREVIEAGRLEVLTFHGNDYEKSRGKGYGEALIIEYAMKNSAFLREDVNIIKITGRLICMNVGKMAKRYARTDTMYALIRKDENNNFELNSQVVVAPSVFWADYFLPQKEMINDSKHYWFEHLLYDVSRMWIEDGHRFKDMWIVFKLKGMSGSNGVAINYPHLNNPFIFYIHYMLHRVGYYGFLKFW